MSPLFLVGLGNPGSEYARTRHNVGFLVVEEIAARLNATWSLKKTYMAEVAEAEWNGRRLLLVKPQTFMNVSGKAVRALLSAKGGGAEQVLVVYDEADLPFGELRYRRGGSAGGHNGMQSILELFPTGTDVARLRVGIGRSPHATEPLDKWVLGRWSKEEEKALADIIPRAADNALAHLS